MFVYPIDKPFNVKSYYKIRTVIDVTQYNMLIPFGYKIVYSFYLIFILDNLHYL